MIRTNLATRPFYNERAVNLWLLAAAVLLAGVTAFNVNRVIHYSRSDTSLARQAAGDEARATELRSAAARLRSSLDPKDLDRVSVDARRANELIEQRTFSWTELFNRLEATLPDEVRMTGVRPQFDRNRGDVLTISVIARGVDDVNQFMDNLEATGAFRQPRSTEERVNDQGQLEASLEMIYLPGSAAPVTDKPQESREREKP
jgi:Tfp pilus assembly protein PilN